MMLACELNCIRRFANSGCKSKPQTLSTSQSSVTLRRRSAMARAEKTEPWYLSERAEYLAAAALTRVAGLSVERQHHASGVDLIVAIEGGKGGRIFGVEVKGVKQLAAIVDDHQRVRKQASDSLRTAV